ARHLCGRARKIPRSERSPAPGRRRTQRHEKGRSTDARASRAPALGAVAPRRSPAQGRLGLGSDLKVALRQRWLENPFFVLGLTPSATRLEVERAGQRL